MKGSIIMATRFGQLTIANMKGGEVLAGAEAEFLSLGERMDAFRERYEQRAIGQKGTLTLTIEIVATKGGNMDVSAKMKVALPGRPAIGVYADVETNETGQRCLFAKIRDADGGPPQAALPGVEKADDEKA